MSSELHMQPQAQLQSQANLDDMPQAAKHIIDHNLVDHIWKPGQSGNPAGRPKQLPTKVKFSEVCRSMLCSKKIAIEYTFPDPKKNVLLTKTFRIESDRTIYHSVVAALIREALGGNIQAIKELIDRCESEPDDSTQGALVIQMNRQIIDKRAPIDGKKAIVDKEASEASDMEALPVDTTTVEPDIVLKSEPDGLKEALKNDQTTNFPSENAKNAIYEQNMPKNDDIPQSMPIEPPKLIEPPDPTDHQNPPTAMAVSDDETTVEALLNG